MVYTRESLAALFSTSSSRCGGLWVGSPSRTRRIATACAAPRWAVAFLNSGNIRE